MKTPEIVARTGHTATSITRTLVAARELGGQGLPQRKRGSGRPRKVTSRVLKSIKRQISKYPYMTAGQLRATVPDVAALLDRSVQPALKKDASTFRVIRVMRTLVRRPIRSNCYSRQFMVKTIKHLDSGMVWGSFSPAGHGGFYFLPRNTMMNAERYKKVMEEHLLPFMKFHQTTHFLLDGTVSRCHRGGRMRNINAWYLNTHMVYL
jgi:hypothetical protein